MNTLHALGQALVHPFIQPQRMVTIPLHSRRHGSSFFWEPTSDGWGWNDLFHDPEGPTQAYRMAGGCQEAARVSDLPYLLPPPTGPPPKERGPKRHNRTLLPIPQEESTIIKVLLAGSKNCCFLGEKTLSMTASRNCPIYMLRIKDRGEKTHFKQSC